MSTHGFFYVELFFCFVLECFSKVSDNLQSTSSFKSIKIDNIPTKSSFEEVHKE